ncbi:MAG: DsrE/DsrF/DrsH-like family protein [Planctomycetales bacterium]|nr:DsrE/DsrF/DrsH-like family protein [Planctomycetales bacterium]
MQSTIIPPASESNSPVGLPAIGPASDSQADIENRLDRLESQLRDLGERTASTNDLNLLVFSGERDKLLAAFVMANGAAACGMQVKLFFTFWASAALRKGGRQHGKKTLVERAFGWLLPGSLHKTKLSKLHMGGIGSRLMANEMKKKNVSDLGQLVATAAELGVSISVCEMSMRLMGIRREELIDYPGLTFCGVTKFVDDASRSNTTLFI